MIGIVTSAVGGAMLWSVAEYGIHNWGGHGPRGKTEFSREHLTHHATPTYFTATIKKAKAAGLALALMAPLAIAALGVPRGVAFAVAFSLAYLGYEWLHRRAHTHAAPRGWLGAYGRMVRKHHFHHHFGAPRSNHGVTSPVWDFVFRTYEPPGVVRVPARHAMTWLVDDGGEIKPEYAADYVLVGRKIDRDAETDRRRAFSNEAPVV